MLHTQFTKTSHTHTHFPYFFDTYGSYHILEKKIINLEDSKELTT